jgi:ribosomal protein S18 acetylase RimI-like enzyme
VTADRVVLRDATADDLPALTDALIEAVNWHGRDPLGEADVMSRPQLAHYVKGWPRPGDFGTMAVAGAATVGAAWCRTFSAEDAGYGYVADDVPELSIGVSPRWRGHGIGTALLDRLIFQARDSGVRAVSLSVEDGNGARTLYERAGFMPVGREGESDVMLLQV